MLTLKDRLHTSIIEGKIPLNEIPCYHLDSLQDVNLFSFNFTDIDSNIFEGIKNVRSIDLSVNKLRSIPEDVFQDLKKIERIDLGYNLIDSLKGSLFKGLDRLELIDL